MYPKTPKRVHVFFDSPLFSPEDFTPYINGRACSAMIFALCGILALVSRADVSASLLGEEGDEAGAVGLRLDVNDGGLLGE